MRSLDLLRRRPRIAIVMLSVQAMCGTWSGHAFEVETHSAIAEKAARRSTLDHVLRNGLHVDEGLDRPVSRTTLLAWLRIGAIREDDHLRFFNHFHNPLADWGFAGFPLSQSSVLWGQNPDQSWSWAQARAHFLAAITAGSRASRDEALARTFRALGQLVHLVQDASVPAHTRNDPHVFVSFETFVDYLRTTDAGELTRLLELPHALPFDWQALSPHPQAPVPVARLIDTDRYTGTDAYRGVNPDVTAGPLIGLAEYANANFLSEDSTWGFWTTLLRPFSYPARSSVIEADHVVRLPTGEWVTRRYYTKIADGDTGYRLATVGYLRDYYVRFRLGTSRGSEKPGLDEIVYRDYAERLLPRAVAYSTALLDYFVRRPFVLLPDPTAPPHTGPVLLNAAFPEETLQGRFELLVERLDGSRSLLTAWDLTLGPGETSGRLASPLLPPDAITTARCLVLFRGQAGHETGAVLLGANQFGCPLDIPPPPPTWYVYSCKPNPVTFSYLYATLTPPTYPEGDAVTHFHVPQSWPEINCSLVAQIPAETQPPNTVTSHPAPTG
jgi:hypothetical protein